MACSGEEVLAAIRERSDFLEAAALERLEEAQAEDRVPEDKWLNG